MKEKETFELLYSNAKKIINNSYSPYSSFKVSAAVLTLTGKVFTGINVENASYGLTVCAERNAIFNAVGNGEKEFSALLIYTETEEFTPPCGACRQVMAEFAPEADIFLTNIYGEYKKFSLKELFPWNFSL